MPHYCPISSTVPHTFTTPTHLTHPPPPLHHHCRTNSALSPSPDGYNTLATNTHANRSLSHEPKNRSPPPPSLPAQQAAQAIHSSPPVSASLFTSSCARCSTSPSYAHREQDPVSRVPNSRARRCCAWRPMRARDTRTTAFPVRALQVAFGNVFSLRTLK